LTLFPYTTLFRSILQAVPPGALQTRRAVHESTTLTVPPAPHRQWQCDHTPHARAARDVRPLAVRTALARLAPHPQGVQHPLHGRSDLLARLPVVVGA